MACIMNAANEVAVEAFLNNEIRFTEIYSIIEQTMQKADFIKNPLIDDYLLTDKETRKVAAALR